MKKEWKKPFVKWVILKKADIVTASGQDEQQRGSSANTNSVIWEDMSGDNF